MRNNFLNKLVTRYSKRNKLNKEDNYLIVDKTLEIEDIYEEEKDKFLSILMNIVFIAIIIISLYLFVFIQDKLHEEEIRRNTWISFNMGMQVCREIDIYKELFEMFEMDTQYEEIDEFYKKINNSNNIIELEIILNEYYSWKIRNGLEQSPITNDVTIV